MGTRTKRRRNYLKNMKILGQLILVVSAGRTYQPPNLRGRCAWGPPCDANKISYGCEKFNDNLGICWSECAGYIPKSVGDGAFTYEGWCYNMNTENVFDLEMGKSGKQSKFARVSRATKYNSIDDVNWDDEQSIQDYFDSIGADGEIMGYPTESYTQCNEDSDCANVARNCRIGCGNREEVIPSF